MVEGKPLTREELENKGSLTDQETHELAAYMLQDDTEEVLKTWREKMRVWDLSPAILQLIVTDVLVKTAINFEG